MEKLKRYIAHILPPAAVLAVVWYVTLPILRYTLMMQEQKGLFLMTPDYFRQVFSDSWPVTTLISDFLVQFYRIPNLGALITALIVMKVYMMTCTIFRFTKFRPLVGGLAAAACWYAVVHAQTPHDGVVILMLAAIAALISLALPYKKLSSGTWKPVALWQSAAVAAMMVGAAYLNVTDEDVRDNERRNAVEYLSRAHDWNTLLQITTPKACIDNESYLPYALLALNAKVQLGEKLYDFPVTGPECLGEVEEKILDWSRYSLRSLIYEVIGCPNEAIHQVYQMGMAHDYGTSFGALRQLIRLEIENGDYGLARKHAQVLSRSPFNRKSAASAMSLVDSKEKETVEGMDLRYDDGFRREDTMITDNSVYNISSIITRCSTATPAAMERLLCHLLLAGNLEGFRQAAAEVFGDAEASEIPRYFRENL